MRADRRWATLLLAAYAALSLGSAWQESATYDEPLHILAGVLAWKTGQTGLNFANTPLAAYWQTLPLVFLRFHAFPPVAQLAGSVYSYSYSFVYHNSYSLRWMLQAPRAMSVILALILGGVLFMWTRQALGSLAARSALVAFAFCPMLLGHGPLVKADLAGALGWVLVFFCAWRWRERPTPARAGAAGLAVGLALCLKYSALLAVPSVMATLWAARPQKQVSAFFMDRSTFLKAAAASLAGVLIVMAMSFRGWGLPAWLDGFSKLMVSMKEGHMNYFWGAYSHAGWKSYFIAAFLLKTPLAFLMLIAWGAMQWRKVSPGDRAFLLPWCFGPVIIIFLVSSLSSIQVGIRHILPVYPFLCIAAGGLIAALWKAGGSWARRGILFLGFWYIAGTATAFPRYLSYFNETIGPSSNGYRYFVDSNLDWGQGLKALGDYLRERGSPEIYLSYFGCADPARYGIRFRPVLMTTCADVGGDAPSKSSPAPLWLAVSATNRVGLYYEPHDIFAWLDKRQPVKIFMDSIWLYDLSQDPEAKARLEFLTRPRPS